LTLNFIAAALTLFGILISDIMYAVVDPRIRVQ
jgi:ABC-type dipeptide/oligopeptide/nickel transport system permease component